MYVIKTRFCFVLSKIANSIQVPGITSGSTAGLRFMCASFYIIIGLAILAMCFDLIKESIVDKFVWYVVFLRIFSQI